MQKLSILVALAAFVAAPNVRSANLACDTPGVAQMIVPDIFNRNPNAQKLGLEVSKVTVLDAADAAEGRACLIAVVTNHGYTLRYRFRFDERGTAALDLVQ
jgi:hypothetical protein